MATNFSANQYENAFAGKRLQNWEIPATFKERPSHLEGYTEPIADNRGHLLGGVQRSQKCPWGGFLGTWDSHDGKAKPKLSAVANGKSKFATADAEILTINSPPPKSASKQNAEKPLSPIPQQFDERDIGISKHINAVKKIESQEAGKNHSPSPPPRTAERTPSPAGSKADAKDVSIEPE
ncbi:protein Flattop homolog [Dendronephthya gigantea]|uniref:protein Flattop homolog n=1 Tax=Dendronephthya gigantea TaxID=151771 RepID=UPI00106B758B|nr:protein Flattop homolog [Dendronephthya gigantea]